MVTFIDQNKNAGEKLRSPEADDAKLLTCTDVVSSAEKKRITISMNIISKIDLKENILCLFQKVGIF